jgi:putative heme iron utilization protein
MADPITPAISDRICHHMNDDHAEAVLLYAKAFAGMAEATAAKMLSINPEMMQLNVMVNDQSQNVEIKFDHVLADSEDAHQTLIAMVKQARSR